ncbi:MAG: type II toxin-antitoxin system Phd/YefM family antitoxin [bacterium]|nr:type II toxin-antitoxin system Phd/YefM family antitoxin [bacterium]
MSKTMAMVDVRRNLTRLPEQLSDSPETGAIAVTRRGKPVLALMSWDLYEAILETMEIMGDEDLMMSIRQGVKEIQEGKGISWEEAQKELNL